MIEYKKIAEYCKKHYPKAVAKNNELCADYLKNIFIFNMPWDMEATQVPVDFGDKIDWKYKPTEDNEFIWQFNRHRFLINLGQEYQLTGDEKFAKKYVYCVLDWIKNATLDGDPAHNREWRSLEVGLRATTWLHAIKYFVGSPSLTSEFIKAFDDSLQQHKDFLLNVDGYRYKLSNWGVIQNHGLFAICCHFGEKDLTKDTLKVAFDRLSIEIDTQIMADGVHWEQSPMYHTEVLNCFTDAIIFGLESGVVFPTEFMEKVRKMALTFLNWIKPNGNQPLTGDSDDTSLRDILSKSAYIFNDGLLKYIATERLDYESAWIFGLDGIDNYDKIQVIKPDFTNVYLEDSGHYILRSDWSDKANYLHFVNGYTGGGHAHCDKLHFDLVAHGKDFLVDSGRYTYYHNDPKRYKLKKPKSHNTFIINNKGFMVNAPGGWSFLKYAPSIKCPVKEMDELVVLQGAHLGYLSFFGGGVATRTILWLKPDIYIIVDSIDGKCCHSMKRFFNFAPEVTLQIDNKKIIAKNGDAKITMHFTGDKTKLIKEISDYSPQYNKLLNNVVITEKGSHTTNRITVIDCSNSCEVAEERIYSKGIKMPKSKGVGIIITRGKDVYNIMVSTDELSGFIHNADDLGGCGKLLILKNGKKVNFYW